MTKKCIIQKLASRARQPGDTPAVQILPSRLSRKMAACGRISMPIPKTASGGRLSDKFHRAPRLDYGKHLQKEHVLCSSASFTSNKRQPHPAGDPSSQTSAGGTTPVTVPFGSQPWCFAFGICYVELCQHKPTSVVSASYAPLAFFFWMGIGLPATLTFLWQPFSCPWAAYRAFVVR